MTATVSKAGPYYSSGAISFSSLRSNFKEATSGSISASELLRNTDTLEENPIVPDAPNAIKFNTLPCAVHTLGDVLVTLYDW